MDENAIKVLLIEDDRIDRMAFERLVKHENLPYNYTIASSLSEAKKNLASGKYDIIISDYNLGDGTAAEIFNSITDTPIIFATGGGDEEIAVNAMKSGAYDYLVKDQERNYLKVLPVTIEKALRHKAAEERLRLFESVIVNGNDAVIITDAEYGSRDGSHIVYVNDAFLQITGYRPEEIVGKTPMILFGEKTNRRELVRIKNAILNAQSVRAELIAYRKDRTEFWIDINIVPVAGNSGKYTHWVSVLRDITSRKKTEEDLIKAKWLAEESMKAKEQFLANMSHEIRTPMNAVVGLTNLMLAMQLDPEQHEYVEAIRQSSDNLLVIINDILDISKIEAGKITFEKIPFSINDLLSRLVKSFRIKAVEKGLKLSLSVDASLPEVVTGDPVRLNQILVNLVGNAIKFTEKGGITIDASLCKEANGEVTVLFEVTDTGIGISAENLDRIFESFSQATSDTTRKFGGTGLGLTISRQLVELQNGEMRVKSKISKGSTFSFTLPLKKGGTLAEQNSSPSGLAHDVNLEHLKVLLVEDNPMNRFVATKTLTTWKIAADTAENGKIALEMLAGKPYDLVLMDVQMPEMDGYEATRRIRHDFPAPLKNLPILAMTAGALKGDAEKCLAAGMDDYISKPFDPDVLFRKIVKLTATRNVTHALHDTGISGNEAGQSEEDVTDLAYIIKLSAGSTEFVAEMIDVFLQQTPVYMEELQMHCREQDWDGLKAVAHKMKPTVSYMGIKQLEPLIREIEEFAKQRQHLDRLPDMIEKLAGVCKKALRELEIKLSEIKLPET